MANGAVTDPPQERAGDRLLFLLLGRDFSRSDGLKWLDFTKRLLAVFVLSVSSVCALLTANSLFELRRVIESGLTWREHALARAAARACYVPVVLEDRAALDRLLASYDNETDLLSIRVVSADGRVDAARARKNVRPRERVLAFEEPITPPAEYADPTRADAARVGSVRVVASLRRVHQEMLVALAQNVAESGVLLMAVLFAGLVLIRSMTRRLWELVGEARMSAALRRSNQELEQFAYVASHDLQSPLRTVTSYVQLLQRRHRGRLEPDAEKLIDSAVAAAARMQALIQDLLEFSRVGRAEAEPEATPLDAVLDQVLDARAEQLRETGATIARGPLPTIMAHPLRQVQLFDNLIGNALKYRGSRAPRLEIGAAERDDEWEMFVRDNGIGIEPQYFDKIFVIFQRLHTRMEYPGTGIGLALCKKIVELGGGRIWVESAPGRGSTFRFTVPKARRRAS